MKRKCRSLTIVRIPYTVSLYAVFLVSFIMVLNGQEKIIAKTNRDVTIIEADKITSKSKNSEISASGNVIFMRDKYKITADKITYDKNKKKIYLDQRAKFIDTENNKIVANRAELSDDAKSGNFIDAGIILNNGLSIVSPFVRKIDDDNYRSSDSDYYFCPNENLDMDLTYEEIVKEIKGGSNNLQIFSLYSKESTISKQEKKIYLKHVFLKFFDIPIFYLPYITTKRPFDNRTSGISAPYFSKNRNYGYAMSVPIDLYFFDNMDINVETTLYQNLNFLSDIKFKYFRDNFLINFNLDYAFDNKQSAAIKNSKNISEKDEGVYKNNRLYGDINSRGIINENTFFRANVKFSTDPYMIRDYFNDYKEYLQSDANLFKINRNDNINLDTVAFRHIRERKKSYIRKTPMVIPAIYYHYVAIDDDLPNYLNFDIKTNAILSISEFGKNYNKILFKPAISYRNIFGKLFLKSNLSLHTDVYNQSYNSTDDNLTYRLYPELELKTIYSLAIFNKIIVQPILQTFMSQNKNLNFIDIDSKNSELTVNNLFSSSRYSGYDLMESGIRFNYGIVNEIPYSYGKFRIILGQGYKNIIDDKYTIRYFSDRFSDILMGISFNYNGIFNINYLNNLNHITFRKNREEFIINGFIYKLYYSASYVHIGNNFNANEQKQIRFTIGYGITKKLRTNINISADLTNKKIIYYGGNLLYEDNCYISGISISRQSFVDSYNEDNFTINFHFRLKGIKI